MSSRLPQTQSLPWTSRSTSTANRSEFDTVYAYRHSNHPSADQYFWQILPRYSRIPDHSAGQLWGSKVRKQHKADKQKSRESRQAPDFTAFRSSDPCILVREKGLEPLHLSALEPKSSASTNSATLAGKGCESTVKPPRQASAHACVARSQDRRLLGHSFHPGAETGVTMTVSAALKSNVLV